MVATEIATGTGTGTGRLGIEMGFGSVTGMDIASVLGMVDLSQNRPRNSRRCSDRHTIPPAERVKVRGRDVSPTSRQRRGETHFVVLNQFAQEETRVEAKRQ